MNPALPVGGGGRRGYRDANERTPLQRSASSWRSVSSLTIDRAPAGCSIRRTPAPAMTTTSSPPVAKHRPMPPLATRVASDRKRSVNESARLLAILASRCPLSMRPHATWCPCPPELRRPEQEGGPPQARCAAFTSRGRCVPTVYNSALSDQHIAHMLMAKCATAHPRPSARQRAQQERMAFTGNITRDSSCQRIGRSSMEP